MRIVYPDDARPPLAPQQQNAAHFEPQILPVGTFKIDGINVLVLFGRVFGVLNRAVGPNRKPVGMGLHPGVVGRALNGQIHRDFQAIFLGRGDELLVIL